MDLTYPVNLNAINRGRSDAPSTWIHLRNSTRNFSTSDGTYLLRRTRKEKKLLHLGRSRRAEKVDCFECKGFVWMWLIKVYKWRRSAIYSLTLNLPCRYSEIWLELQENKLPRQSRRLFPSAPLAATSILAQRNNVFLSPYFLWRCSFLYWLLAHQIDTYQ